MADDEAHAGADPTDEEHLHAGAPPALTGDPPLEHAQRKQRHQRAGDAHRQRPQPAETRYGHSGTIAASR